jgi:hypothetical protein
VTLSDAPTLTGFAVNDPRVTPESAALTVRESVAVAVLPFPSVTVRVTVKGEPVLAVGVQLMETALELLHPGGRWVQA